MPLLQFAGKPCVVAATSLPGGPICAPGEAPGANVPAFLVAGCPEAHYARPPELAAILDSFLPPGIRLYAVGNTPTSTSGTSFIAIFTAPGPVPQGSRAQETVRAFDVTDGYVVGATFACPDRTPEQFLKDRNINSFLVPPP